MIDPIVAEKLDKIAQTANSMSRSVETYHKALMMATDALLIYANGNGDGGARARTTLREIMQAMQLEPSRRREGGN